MCPQHCDAVKEDDSDLCFVKTAYLPAYLKVNKIMMQYSRLFLFFFLFPLVCELRRQQQRVKSKCILGFS